jgi:hypothetical protein
MHWVQQHRLVEKMRTAHVHGFSLRSKGMDVTGNEIGRQEKENFMGKTGGVPTVEQAESASQQCHCLYTSRHPRKSGMNMSIGNKMWNIP